MTWQVKIHTKIISVTQKMAWRNYIYFDRSKQFIVITSHWPRDIFSNPFCVVKNMIGIYIECSLYSLFYWIEYEYGSESNLAVCCRLGNELAESICLQSYRRFTAGSAQTVRYSVWTRWECSQAISQKENGKRCLVLTCLNLV